MFGHRDGEPGIFGGAFAKPLQCAPAILLWKRLAFQSGCEHVLKPTIRPRAKVAFLVVKILEQAGHGIDGPMANYTVGRLHPRGFVLGIDGGGVGYLIGQRHHINAEEMLVIHAGPKAVAIGVGGRIAAQVLECAEQTGVRIITGLGFLHGRSIGRILAARPQLGQACGHVLEGVVHVLEAILHRFKNAVAPGRVGRDHDVVRRHDFGERLVVSHHVGDQFQRFFPNGFTIIAGQRPAGSLLHFFVL